MLEKKPFQGHGERGEVVAQYTATEFQKRLMNHELFQKDISEACQQTFVSVDSSLEDEKDIDVSYTFYKYYLYFIFFKLSSNTIEEHA